MRKRRRRSLGGEGVKATSYKLQLLEAWVVRQKSDLSLQAYLPKINKGEKRSCTPCKIKCKFRSWVQILVQAVRVTLCTVKVTKHWLLFCPGVAGRPPSGLWLWSLVESGVRRIFTAPYATVLVCLDVWEEEDVVVVVVVVKGGI